MKGGDGGSEGTAESGEGTAESGEDPTAPVRGHDDPEGPDAAQRMREVVEAMERSAEEILATARDEARHQVEDARQRASRLAEERIASLESTAETLVAEAEAVGARLRELSASIDRVRSELDAELEWGLEAKVEEQPEPSPSPRRSRMGDGPPKPTASVLTVKPGASRATVKELAAEEWALQRSLRLRGRFSRADEPDAESIGSAPPDGD